MRKHKIPHDPFHDNEAQVKSHVLPPEPPDLVSIDEDASRGGVNVPPRILEDDGFRSAFKPEPEHKPVKPIYTGRGK